MTDTPSPIRPLHGFFSTAREAHADRAQSLLFAAHACGLGQPEVQAILHQAVPGSRSISDIPALVLIHMTRDFLLKAAQADDPDPTDDIDTIDGPIAFGG